jgi:hypothetical protein
LRRDHADFYAYNDAYLNQYAEPQPFAFGHKHAVADLYPYRDAVTVTVAVIHVYTHSYRYQHSVAYVYKDGNAHVIAFTQFHLYADGDGHIYKNSHRIGVAVAHLHKHGHTDGFSDAHFHAHSVAYVICYAFNNHDFA